METLVFFQEDKLTQINFLFKAILECNDEKVAFKAFLLLLRLFGNILSQPQVA